jgi:2-polyprenyl-6-methoxyphenol hydroxylase-like FAD-dependent oxidoreductase
VRRTTFRYGPEEIVITIKPSHGVDALYAPRRTLLDFTLARAAIADGADVHHETAVHELVFDAGRVAGVRAVSADGRFVELRAPLVVGADGVRSIVARLVDAPFTRVGGGGSAVTYGYWSELDTDGYEWMFEPDACCGVIPTNDGQTCVFASASRTRIGHGGTERIIEIAAEASPATAARLQAARRPGATRTWTGQPGYLRRAHGAGWALVGDAGYFKDPLSAHGLTDALRDAELLARAVLAGWPGGRCLEEHLARYESTRDRLSLPLFDVVDRIAGQRWETAEIGGLLRRLSSSMADEVEALAELEPAAVS